MFVTCFVDTPGCEGVFAASFFCFDDEPSSLLYAMILFCRGAGLSVELSLYFLCLTHVLFVRLFESTYCYSLRMHIMFIRLLFGTIVVLLFRINGALSSHFSVFIRKKNVVRCTVLVALEALYKSFKLKHILSFMIR